MSELQVITGAFSYTGKYVTRRLLQLGVRVRTLTGHPNRPNPFGVQVETAPFSFADPERLAQSLAGATTLYNTYWVRFPYGGTDYDRAVHNSEILFRMAKAAGIRRVVHVSIANPDPTSPLPYYSGKARVEAALRASGLSYSILRPTVVFGPEDILINNIAWLLRRLPIFGVPGSGAYRVQPIFVEDLADLIVAAGQAGEDRVQDAVGPETYTYLDLVRLISTAVGSRASIVHLAPALVLAVAKVVGWATGDVLLTRDEVRGLMADLLVSHEPATGKTLLSQWLRDHAATLGTVYASELRRHFR